MSVKKKPYKLGLTFGVFDMFHIGHLKLLQNAKKMCDELIVCVSTDVYCKHRKGKKPMIPLRDRMQIIRALSVVDKVDIQSESFTKYDAIEEFMPNVLFVGDDWTPKTYEGLGNGIPVEFLPYTKNVSSTILRKKLELE